MTEYMQLVGEEAQAVVAIVNWGIDSRLEAFVKSKFEIIWHTTSGALIPNAGIEQYDPSVNGSLLTWKLHCSIDEDEWGLFLRRMCELGDMSEEEGDLGDCADDLLNAILEVWYDQESR